MSRRRFFLRCMTAGAVLTGAAMALALFVIWDQSQTKGRAWSR